MKNTSTPAPPCENSQTSHAGIGANGSVWLSIT